MPGMQISLIMDKNEEGEDEQRTIEDEQGELEAQISDADVAPDLEEQGEGPEEANRQNTKNQQDTEELIKGGEGPEPQSAGEDENNKEQEGRVASMEKDVKSGSEDTIGEPSRERGHSAPQEKRVFLMSPEERQAMQQDYKYYFEMYRSTREQNNVLQARLYEHFKKRETNIGDTSDRNVESKEVTAEKEATYEHLAAKIVDLRKKYAEVKEETATRLAKLKEDCEINQKEVQESYASFVRMRAEAMQKAVYARGNKPIAKKDIEEFFAAEAKWEAKVAHSRMENIKLQNKVDKLEDEIKKREKVAGGLQLIDFEQLKIENQTYNEKIEERTEDLSKFKKKLSCTVQMLTHLKEKSEAIHNEKIENEARLKQADEALKAKRDALSKLKHSRDRLKAQNQKLEKECGLLIKPQLLNHYGETKDKNDSIVEDHKKITMKTKQLNLKTGILKKKIEQVH